MLFVSCVWCVNNNYTVTIVMVVYLSVFKDYFRSSQTPILGMIRRPVFYLESQSNWIIIVRADLYKLYLTMKQ